MRLLKCMTAFPNTRLALHLQMQWESGISVSVCVQNLSAKHCQLGGQWCFVSFPTKKIPQKQETKSSVWCLLCLGERDGERCVCVRMYASFRSKLVWDSTAEAERICLGFLVPFLGRNTVIRAECPLKRSCSLCWFSFLFRVSFFFSFFFFARDKDKLLRGDLQNNFSLRFQLQCFKWIL